MSQDCCPTLLSRASTTPSNRSRHRGVRSSRPPSQKETCGSRHSVIPLAMCSASSSKEFADREGRPRPRLLRLPQVGWDRGNPGRHSRMGSIHGLRRFPRILASSVMRPLSLSVMEVSFFIRKNDRKFDTYSGTSSTLMKAVRFRHHAECCVRKTRELTRQRCNGKPPPMHRAFQKPDRDEDL